MQCISMYQIPSITSLLTPTPYCTCIMPQSAVDGGVHSRCTEVPTWVFICGLLGGPGRSITKIITHFMTNCNRLPSYSGFYDSWALPQNPCQREPHWSKVIYSLNIYQHCKTCFSPLPLCNFTDHSIMVGLF